MEHNKFTESEVIVGVMLLTLPVDAFSFIIDWTGVGLAIAPILQSAAMFATWLWLRSKGDTTSLKFWKQLLRYLSNLLPLIPTVTIVFFIEVYLHNHPESGVAKLTKGATMASGIKAGAAAEGGIKEKVRAGRRAYRDTVKDLGAMGEMGSDHPEQSFQSRNLRMKKLGPLPSNQGDSIQVKQPPYTTHSAESLRLAKTMEEDEQAKKELAKEPRAVRRGAPIQTTRDIDGARTDLSIPKPIE